MAEPLFRDEVMRARQSPWLGGIVIARSPSAWLLTGLAAAAALVVGLFLAFGEYTRRTRVTGMVVPSLGLASVGAPLAGTLSEVRVGEGRVVAEGDILAVVSAPRATLAGGDGVAALEAALRARRRGVADGHASQRTLIDAQQAGLAAQRDAARAELAQLRAEERTRRRQHALAEQALARYRGLHARQYVASLQLQQQEAAVLELQAARQSLERQALALQRQAAQFDQQLRELPSRRAAVDASEQRELASLAQETVEASSRAERVLRAPVAGVVSALLGQAGQAVQPGQPVLSLLPAGSSLEVHLLVPSRAVGFVAPGDAVRLRYRAFPYQKFGHHGGRVLRISRSALTEAELGPLLGRAAPPGESLYRVVVAPDRDSVRAFGREEPLRPGMLLEADLLGERRKLWEWLAEPLFALSGTLSADTGRPAPAEAPRAAGP